MGANPTPDPRRRSIGRPLPRLEDGPLLTGEATFVADLRFDGALEVVFVRSIVAHGALRSVALEEARGMRGVVAAYTAADLPDLPAAPATQGSEVPSAMERPSLARDRVRFVGEPVAVIVAEDASSAEDAAETVLQDVDPLPAIIDPVDAASGPPLFDGHDNVASVTTYGEDPDADLRALPVVVELRVRQPRLAPASIETRRIVVVPRDDGLEVWCSHQAPHRLRDHLAEGFGFEPRNVRVVAPNVGGAFGAKSQTWPEYLVVAAVALRLGRAVRWVEGRNESFLAGPHGRAQVQWIRLGADRDGRVLALSAEIDADAGAYPHTGALVSTNTGWVLSGPYRIPRLGVRVRAVVTNTAPTAPYRGAGRPEAAFLLERAMDELARKIDIDPVEVRRRNLIPPDAFPYRSPTGAVYDAADHPRALALALETARYDEVRSEQSRRGTGDPLLGIGVACYIERSGGAPGSHEYGEVAVTADGDVRVLTGSSSQGQGHRTAFAQIVADALELSVEEIGVVQGDTAEVPEGVGTFASRSMQIGGSAAHRAAIAIVHRAREVAAKILEVAEADLSYADGVFSIVGSPDRTCTLRETAARDGGISASDVWASDQAFPSGVYVAVVEIDRETGLVTLRELVAVDDCGTVINPLLTEGQVLGSVAQGIGQALHEVAGYDDGGEPLATSFVSYAIASVSEMAPTVTRSVVTPSPTGPLGARGAGEAGCIGAPPAIVNAVADALRGYDTSSLEMPVTPEQVWRILRRGPVDAREAAG